MEFKKNKLSVFIMGYVLSLGMASTVSAETINNNQYKEVSSVWNDGDSQYIVVGAQSHGSLSVINGGEVYSDSLSIALENGSGTVDITDGGRIILNQTSSSVYALAVGGGDGNNSSSGSTGILNISGPYSEFYSLADGLNVIGSDGAEGHLTVSDGAKMLLMADDNGSNGLFIGYQGDFSGKGSVTVDGPGSAIDVNSRIVVGAYNEGTATISNGGMMSGTEITVGLDAATNNFNSVLLVTGHGSEVSGGTAITIGYQGAGTAIVTDGGRLSAREIHIAKEAGSTGELIIGARKDEDAASAGDIDVDVIRFGFGDASLTLNHTESDYVLSSALDGMGTINAVNGTTYLEGHNSGYGGRLVIFEPATIVLTDSNQLGMSSGITNNGTLNIVSSFDWGFNNEMSGYGTLNVNTNGNQFNFGPSQLMSAFEGTVVLENTYFELTGTNTDSLNNVDLILGQDSFTTVGHNNQMIGGLAFDGGIIKFGTVTPGKEWTENQVNTTGTLDISGSGTVQVDFSGDVNNDRPPVAPVPLLQQDDDNVLVLLADSMSGSVVGSGGMLTLLDSNGQVISDGVTHGITQNGQIVANGTYDYRLTSGHNNDGLYISYGLTEVELLGTGNDALVLDAAGATGAAADLSAKITGSGDLAIDTGNGYTLSLSNGLNDYSGETQVYSGNLEMRSDNVLGNTSLLQLRMDSSFNMNGHTQTIGQLMTDAPSALEFNGGSLNIMNGGQVLGKLSGGGALMVNSGQLYIYGANQNLSVSTTIDQNATVTIDDSLGLGGGNVDVSGELEVVNADGVLYNSLSNQGNVTLTDSRITLAGNNADFSGIFAIDADSQLTAADGRLGTADVHNNGALVIQASADWLLNNVVQGTGSLTKQGSGIVTLSDSATYTGSTNIQHGGIVLGSEGSSMTLASDRVSISSNAFLAGFGGVSGSIDNEGTLYVGSHNSGTNAIQTFTIGQDLTNDGTIYIGHKTNARSINAGNQLHVLGNYTSNDGHIHFNTTLNGDGSITDHMIIDGDTSGRTYVSVDNAGGSGAPTINGIELIQVNGQSNGEFVQSGRIVAGAYDYSLARGAGTLNSNWYLTSLNRNGSGGEQNERPEAGAYVANVVEANNMFVTRLHDRLGETQYTDALTGEKKATSLWLRQVGGMSGWHSDSGQLKTKSYRYVIQLGGDIAQWSSDGLDRWHIGAMAGYANGHNKTSSNSTAYSSKGDVNGYNSGLYATWYQNDEEENGLYVDSWVQYSWFNNNVDGEKLARESYKSKGITASIESGYTYKLGDFGSDSTTSWYIRPHAQAVWMGVKADDHVESNGTHVSSSGDGNLMARLGLRTYFNNASESNKASYSQIQPFVEVNWIHNTKDFSTTMNGVKVNQDGARNLGEVKLGVEGQLNRRLNVWGNVATQLGDKDYYDASATLGVKYHF